MLRETKEGDERSSGRQPSDHCLVMDSVEQSTVNRTRNLKVAQEFLGKNMAAID